MNNHKAKRIVAIDLMRAFAVLMMIQGHTTAALLDKSYASSGSLFYNVWYGFRAFTAPLFIFVSGFIFTFLLYNKGNLLKGNPRAGKGIWRGISLIIIGYLLRYPTINILNLSSVSREQWQTFFAFDALHLIGTGLLLILFFAFISEKLKYNPLFTFVGLAFVIFFLSPIINSMVTSNSKNIFLVSIISRRSGSLFPVFPYLQYIFIGAALGKIVADNKTLLKKKLFLLVVAIIGVTFLLLSFVPNIFNSGSLLGIGVVLILFSLFSAIGNRLSSMPVIVQSFARNSLWIYIIHLVIIYGSPVSIGLYQIIGSELDFGLTLLITLSMIILMILISLRIDKFKNKKLNYL